MKQRPTDLLVFALIAASVPVLGSAAELEHYAGRWAVQSGRSNLLIIDIPSKAGAVAPAATLLRPEHFEMYPKANGVRAISGPYVNFNSIRVTPGRDDVAIIFANPANPNDKDEIRFSRIDDEHGEIQFVGTSLPPISVLRIKADEGPFTKWEVGHAYGITDSRPSNVRMTAIFEADQNNRQTKPINWATVGKADAYRRREVQKLLISGQLHTGEDYYHAAFIFQHGDDARDYLLAHSLAMVASAKKQPDASWIASATLDRYLQSIGQPQIFGTQFKHPADGVITQQPIDQRLISDAIRSELGVGTLAEQEAQRVKMQNPFQSPKSAPTNVDPSHLGNFH